MTALLHSEASSLAHFLAEKLGYTGELIFEVIISSILDSLKLVPFLLVTYLFMEYIEHKQSKRLASALKKSGSYGPLVGGTLGAVPQCGFSVMAANLYTGGVIGLGTLIAVFLSTSDEMLPLLIAGNIEWSKALLIILYKSLMGILAGFTVNLVMKLSKKENRGINIDELCEDAGCDCESGILRSALRHTLSVGLFILIFTTLLNAVIFFVGGFDGFSLKIPFLSHLVCAFIGLIPNCAASVALTKLALSGFISTGAMLSGLFAGAGVGLAVLFRINKRTGVNLFILALLLLFGTVFGMIADLIPFLKLA